MDGDDDEWDILPMWREASNQSRWSPPVLAGRSVLGGSSPARGGRARWAEGGRGDEASRGRDIGDAALARSPRHSVITSGPSGSKNAAVVASGSSKDAAVRVPQDMPDLPRAVSLPRTSLSRPREVLLDGGYLHVGDLGVLQSIDLVGAGAGPAIIEGCVTLDCGAAQAGGKLRNLVLRGRGGTVVTIISGVWELTGCRVESAGHGCGIKVGDGAACILSGCSISGGLQGIHYLPGSWGRVSQSTMAGCEVGVLCSEQAQVQVEECRFSGIRTARLWHSGSEHKSAVFGKNADDEESLAEGRKDVGEQRTATPHIQNVTIMSKRSGGVAVSPGGEGGGAARPGSWNIEAKGKSGGQAAGLDANNSTGAGHSLSSDGAKVHQENGAVWTGGGVDVKEELGETWHRGSSGAVQEESGGNNRGDRSEDESMRVETPKVSHSGQENGKETPVRGGGADVGSQSKFITPSPKKSTPSRPTWSTGNSKRRGKGWKMKVGEETPTKPKTEVEVRMQDLQEAVGEMTSEIERNGQMIRLSCMEYVRQMGPMETALEALVQKQDKETANLRERVASLEKELEAANRRSTVSPVQSASTSDEEQVYLLESVQDAMTRAAEAVAMKKRESEEHALDIILLTEQLRQKDQEIEMLNCRLLDS